MTAAPDVLLPSSEDEAVAAFGDGTGVTVVAGGTIVLPELTSGRLRPAKAVMLGRAGLAGISRDGTTVTIGAATPVGELVELPAPIGPCAANIADGEIRGQATLGGNLCAGASDAPRGDLQGAFLAVGAVARSAGADGIVSGPLEEFLPAREGRLLLDLTFEEPAAGAFAALDRPHTHDFTALAVSAARGADGTVRVALTGAASHGVRLPSAEAKADDPEAAGAAASADATFADDALASAWYRERTLPVLVQRALEQLREAS
jgi:aerobic carbon-monoxide dehydrogenase medium subunit